MRTSIREVKWGTGTNTTAIVTDWWYAMNADKCEIVRAWATLEAYMRDQVNSSLSDGECLDIAIELFDDGISRVECSNEEE